MTKIIGLTGPSGSGKGAAGAILQKYGIPTIDTDAVYHTLLLENGPCTKELIAAFGTEILGSNGLVDRKKLAAAVFGQPNTPDLLHTLNTITHKYIMAKTHELVREHAANGATAVVIDAPLLFEAGIECECDLVLGVVAESEISIARIMARDGISREAAERRLAAQHDAQFLLAHCDAVLHNNADLQALEVQLCQFLKDFGVVET